MIQEYDGDYNKNAAKRPEHDISDGEILDRENSFSSRAMLIRYSEEKVSLSHNSRPIFDRLFTSALK